MFIGYGCYIVKSKYGRVIMHNFGEFHGRFRLAKIDEDFFSFTVKK